MIPKHTEFLEIFILIPCLAELSMDKVYNLKAGLFT